MKLTSSDYGVIAVIVSLLGLMVSTLIGIDFSFGYIVGFCVGVVCMLIVRISEIREEKEVRYEKVK